MRIVLAVGGGIAAYKAPDLARLLIQQGHQVQAVLTRAAQEFTTPLTLATLTGSKVITGLFSSANPEATLSSAVEHIGVAQENQVLVVAPATADIMAKFANGLADDFLSTMYLAFRGRVILAPAMNNNMWQHAATQANLTTLRQRGSVVVEPEEGFLACGSMGPGRLAELDRIVAAVHQAEGDLNAPSDENRSDVRTRPIAARRDLEDETILITAGPTQEPLDPVRYISNRSSGKMGFALAQAALARGARVILISGPVHIEPPPGAEVVSVRTALEMREQVMAYMEPATIVIKTAAVADFRVSQIAKQKIKKLAARISIELDPNPDILLELGSVKGDRLLIGFAAETENLREESMRKLQAKNCDLVVGNLVGEDAANCGTGFDSDENEVVLALRTGEFIPLPRASKREISERILDLIPRLRLESMAETTPLSTTSGLRKNGR